MRVTGRTITTALAVGLFLCVTLAPAQVVPSQDGRSLDANPGLGSRYNSRAPSGVSLNSQLYVTGQVTGLSYFHGQTGYGASNSIQANVPSSAMMSSFHRQSTNLSQALAGQTYMTAPYYDRGQTVMKVDSILAGRAAPGSNVPISSVPSATSLGQQLYIDALADYRMVQASRAGQTLLPELSRTLPQARLARSAVGARDSLPGTSGTSGFFDVSIGPSVPATLLTAPSLSAGDLFGISRGRQQKDLAYELYLQAHAEDVKARQGPTGPNRHLDGAVSTPFPLGVDPAGAGVADANQVGSQIITGGAFRRPRGAPARNQDVFMDMLISLRRVRDVPTASATPAVGSSMTGPKLAIVGLVEWRGGRTMFIRSLAGTSKDRFNVQMTRAGELLRAKRFYEAAFTYEKAGLQDSRNPLARVGRGLSLLGAGETLSAACEIERAMKIYPPLAQARLDLPKMMGESVIRKQLAILEDRIEAASPEVRHQLEFLAVYLYYNERQFDKAKSYAQRLVKSVPQESLIGTYAENVLSDFKPKPASTQPKKDEPAGTTTEASDSKDTSPR